MKELRWLAEYVVEFSDMSNFAKEIALDFISEADETQLKVLLMDGMLVLDADKKLVESEFKKSNLPVLLEYETSGRKTAMSVAGLTIGLGPVWWAVYRAIRSAFDKCTERCGTFKINNRERQVCMQKCKEERDKKIANLKAKAKMSKKK